MRPLRQLRVVVSALEENIAREAHRADVLVDVTADAFGLGVDRVAAAARAAGVPRLFVATMDGALATRRLVPDLEIVVGRATADRGAELDEARISVDPAGGRRIVRDEVYGFDGRSRVTASLRTEVLSTKHIRAGDGVSYGYTYRASRDECTALVALGYGDGVHRHAGNVSTVSIDGSVAPIVGRVAMNVFVVSLGDRLVRPGAPVVLFGDPDDGDPALADWSRALGVQPAAVVAGIGNRVERVES
ncbi:alanine racemase-like protein [Labedella gwakjiensis]|uniref:Alanine racemase-like protein n=1 Tax=Labedella gwakjiensis TaxID=390269 RepID=A0A2P8GZN7_9MICO|nr:alanine racemase C-terminal domain-containing protein [Labedella gwakjiensis]PSL39425.1 alanine racemase-like protein [Labedella gwakjiensis]RUQ86169.1 hypothetical protein ELQ93_03945 [Labedella gwakjiensis]